MGCRALEVPVGVGVAGRGGQIGCCPHRIVIGGATPLMDELRLAARWVCTCQNGKAHVHIST